MPHRVVHELVPVLKLCLGQVSLGKKGHAATELQSTSLVRCTSERGHLSLVLMNGPPRCTRSLREVIAAAAVVRVVNGDVSGHLETIETSASVLMFRLQGGQEGLLSATIAHCASGYKPRTGHHLMYVRLLPRANLFLLPRLL